MQKNIYFKDSDAFLLSGTPKHAKTQLFQRFGCFFAVWDPEKNKKAYSYFGTICKNYLMGQIIKDQKETNRKVSYEDISTSIQERPDMIYRIDDDIVDTNLILTEYVSELKEFIDDENLNENEKKLVKSFKQAMYEFTIFAVYTV